MRNDIAISTVSWIRSPEESQVVLETITYLSKLGVPIVIVDAGSPPQDLEKIKLLDNITLFENASGLTKQLVLSQQEAAKLGEHLFYLHTDKSDFARDTAAKAIELYRSLEKKGMLIPTRTEKSLDTYPYFQKKEEEYLNYFMSDYIGVPADYYAGPKIYPAALASYLDKLQGDIGWGIEAYFYAIAKRLSMPFEFFPFSMESPKDVDDQEKTKKYRLRITQWQIEGLIQGQEVDL